MRDQAILSARMKKTSEGLKGILQPTLMGISCLLVDSFRKPLVIRRPVQGEEQYALKKCRFRGV